MRTSFIKIIFIICMGLFLNACNSLFDKDNLQTPVPLTDFVPKADMRTIWVAKAGSGFNKTDLKLMLSQSPAYLYTANYKGYVNAIDKSNGQIVWTKDTKLSLSAGPSFTKGQVYVGSREGRLLALNASNGQLIWQTQAPSEILAKPVANNHSVLVRTIDGKLTSFSTKNGNLQWHYNQSEPNLILRATSAPQLGYNFVVAGFANGNLVKLTLTEGNLIWETPISTPQGSFAIERMIDIAADPVIAGSFIYAATYQGHIAAVQLNSGEIAWVQSLSSYTGISVDQTKIFASDANSYLWALQKDDGKILWKQTQLEARRLTSPVLIGNYLVVGDSEGYLHCLDKKNGRIIARLRLGSSPIVTTPLVDHHTLYVLNSEGLLTALTITSTL